VEFGGNKKIVGFNNLVDGSLEDEATKAKALESILNFVPLIK
jgi:hypothetical protein